MIARWTVSAVLIFGLVLAFACSAKAQPSGVTGDGVSDLYYFPTDGLSVMTSFGMVSRPAGTLLLDSDNVGGDWSTATSFDIVAVLVGGQNVSTPNGALGCDICNDFRLPTGSSSGTPVAGGTYTVGFAGGATQWIRTSPLSGTAFRGVIGTGWVRNNTANTVNVGWPTDLVDPDDPEPPASTYFGRFKQGLANYGPGLGDGAFPRIFNDGLSETLWNVRLARDNGATVYTNVTILPEPAAGLLGLLSLAGMSLLRRRFA